jgi:hypothetical protein
VPEVLLDLLAGADVREEPNENVLAERVGHFLVTSLLGNEAAHDRLLHVESVLRFLDHEGAGPGHH